MLALQTIRPVVWRRQILWLNDVAGNERQCANDVSEMPAFDLGFVGLRRAGARKIARWPRFSRSSSERSWPMRVLQTNSTPSART